MSRKKPTHFKEFTLAIQDAIVDNIRHGMAIKPAVQAAGRSYNTHRKYYLLGESGDLRWKGYYERINQARGQGESNYFRKLRDAVDETNDWRGYAYILERRYSENWTQRQKVEVVVEKELEAILTHLEMGLPPAVYEQVLDCLSTMDALAESQTLDQHSRYLEAHIEGVDEAHRLMEGEGV